CEANAGFLRRSLQTHLGRLPCLSPEELRGLDTGLGDWLGLCPLPGPADTPQAGTIAVSFAAVRRFLECPLQGWAGVQLGMREEELEDALVREDEHFATPAL